MTKCIDNKCKRKARWEIGFSFQLNDTTSYSSSWEFTGNNDYQEIFCDKHFSELNGCGNVVCFRRIGDSKWKRFDDYDNYFILKDLVKESYKLFITHKLKIRFKKINSF